MVYFEYGQKELEYLKNKDKRLGNVIDRFGFIKREVNPDLFSALINAIVGQQISTKAQRTIWDRMISGLGMITPDTINKCSLDKIQSYGITFKKANYIKDMGKRVLDGEINLKALKEMDDDEVRTILSSFGGVGNWTAEMAMIFSMQRPNILSYGDFAIHRGICTVYHHKKVDKELFEKYRRRYSPFGTIASFYLWAVANGDTTELP